uniref:hypothetical protein n=1 Tax=Pseudomonas sp. S11A4 TaxID=1476791 RepID=UPI0031582E8D
MANDLKLQVLLNAIDRASGPLKAIDKGSIGAARALKDARDRLKELNAQQKDVSAWRTQRAAAEQTETALTSARDKVRAQSAVCRYGRSHQGSGQDFRTAVREAQRLRNNTSSSRTITDTAFEAIQRRDPAPKTSAPTNANCASRSAPPTSRLANRASDWSR